MYLVFSTSLDPDSRSRILARAAVEALDRLGVEVQFIDIAEQKLPACDASSCYSDPNVVAAKEAIEAAEGVLVAAPIYNYDVGSSTKNLIELTGKVWTDKVVGILCAAGGAGSFMAPMGLANSLMLDFRSLILPRFIFAKGEDFSGDQISDKDCETRIEELVRQLIRISSAVGNRQENQ